MKRITAFLFSFIPAVCLSGDPPQPMSWTQVSEFHFTQSQVILYGNNVVYGGTHLPTNYGFQPGSWITYDLSPLGVPNDSDPNGSAKFAYLAGMLIITHGTTAEVADMHLTFRLPGDLTADPTKYMGQTTEGNIGGGQRSNVGLWVPVKNGKIEYYYTVVTPGAWPTNSSYGINFSIQGWAR